MTKLLTELIGESPGVVAVREQVAQLLQRPGDGGRLPPILISGETGTGKGLLARAIHRAGPRAAGAFVDVNCAAIPESLLEAELFGFERGAFTDARHAKAGLFQTAHRGSIFLDEIGLLPEALQAKLLKVLEDRTVRRLGSTRVEPVDVWILAATNEDLEAAVRGRRFREELYHRLAVLTIRLPPLRERGRDILVLAEHFLARACADYGLQPRTLAEDAREALLSYQWPGNVRELGNVVERVTLLSEEPVITGASLGLGRALRDAPKPADAVAASEGDEAAGRRQLVGALEETGGNVSRTAARLGLSRNTLRYRMEKYGLRPGREASSPTAQTAAARPPGPSARPDPEEPGSERLRPRSPRHPPLGEQAAVGGQSPEVAAEPAQVGSALPDVESDTIHWNRRHVALLRADLTGPPRVEHHPDTNGALESLVDQVRSFDGRIEELGQTRIVAAFGIEPLEDAPRHAAHAALAILKATERTPPGGPRLGVKVGIHVEQAMVGSVGGVAQIDSDAKREAWALLESLVARAEANAVLVSDMARPFLERRFNLTPIALSEGTPAPIYRLRGRDPTELGLGDRLTKFIGRHGELARLERAWQEARRGALRTVNVAGEAGIGKSRLLHELRRRLQGERVLVLPGHCGAFGGSTPLLPFIEVVRSTFLLGEGERPDEVARKLRQGLDLLGLATEAEAMLPFLLALLGLEGNSDTLRGLDEKVIGTRTRDVLVRLLRERCQLSPVVLILDDLHWIDLASQELLMRVIESEEGLPLLVLCAYRPPYRPPWTGRPAVSELVLDPLSEESCLQLVQARLGTSALAPALARMLIEKAEGNPLFAEEITRYLLESGGLRQTDKGLELRAGQESVTLPDTLQHLLLARVERLGGGPRAVLQVASVIGRRFAPELIRAVLDVDDDLGACLRSLEDQELVFRQAPDGREEHLFKHVLVQDAIYDSLPAPRRAELHERVAEAIERLYPTQLGEWVEVLAHHYSRTSRVEKAARYLALAGEKSLRVYSLEEAHHCFRQVLELLETVPGRIDEDLLADAFLSWVRVYYYQSNFRGLTDLVARYRSRVEALGDARRLSLLLFWEGFSHFHGGQYDLARPVLERSLALAESLNDEECLGYASMGLMFVFWLKRGDRPPDIVRQLSDRVLRIADRLGDVYLGSQRLLCLAFEKLTGGRYNESREHCARLLDLGRRTGDPRAMAMGLSALAHVNVYDERYREALEQAEEALRLSPSPADRLTTLAAKGAALARMGRAREGVEILREVRREIIEGDRLTLLLAVDYPYGAALALAGEMDAGVRVIEQAIRRFTAWGTDSPPAFGHMILGEVYLRMVQGGTRIPLRTLLRNLGFVLRSRPFAARKARRHLEEGIRITRSLGVPAILARCLLNMGLLDSAQKQHDEAARHLEEALQVAQSVDMHVLQERIRAALAALPSEGSPSAA
jgi:transcriptional regulator with AAA-type ATPase domain/tetratricopeptide (TPR) repeat protein